MPISFPSTKVEEDRERKKRETHGAEGAGACLACKGRTRSGKGGRHFSNTFYELDLMAKLTTSS